MRRPHLFCLLLAGITLGLYAPVWHFDLVAYDDPLFVTDCPEIQSGLNWQSFLWAWSSVILANWHPVTTLSFLLGHQLWGTNPGLEHGVNALLHAANAALLFWTLHRFTGSVWRAGLVAAIFAWHPLRAESVAWITERKDVLSGLFFCLTLLTYRRYVQAAQVPSLEPQVQILDAPKSKGAAGTGAQASRDALAAPGGGARLNARGGRAPQFMGWEKPGIWFALSLLMLALGLMSKAMLVTVPCILLLLDFWPLQRWSPAGAPGWGPLPRLAWEKGPFFAVAAGFSVLTFIVQQQAGAVNSLTQLGWDDRVGNALLNYGRYLGKGIWPVDLAVVYPYDHVLDWTLPGLAAVLLVVATLVGLWLAPQLPWLLVGWLWYLGMSVPIIGLVQVGEAPMSDRYTYLTLIGPVLGLVWSLPRAWGERPAGRFLLGAGAGAVLVALLALAQVQIGYWHDGVALFNHTVAVTKNNPGGESGLAIALEHAKRYDEAMVHFRRSQELDPGGNDYFLKSGYCLMLAGRWEEAAVDLQTAVERAPKDLLTQETLGTVLRHLGRNNEARAHWEAAVKLEPDGTDVLNNLAWLLAACADPSVRDGVEAVRLGEHACALTHGEKTLFLGTLANAYAEAGRFDDAVATAQKAIDQATAHGETELAAKNRELLAVYQRHQAWHEP